MIHYSLTCENAHQFDGWFRNASAYEQQREKSLLTCPTCSSTKVSKALMAPAVPRPGHEKVALSLGHPQQEQWRAAMAALRRKIVSEADDVGERFAEEARKVHFREVEPRAIYGKASSEEVAGLLEDGVDFMPLPPLPEEHN